MLELISSTEALSSTLAGAAFIKANWFWLQNTFYFVTQAAGKGASIHSLKLISLYPYHFTAVNYINENKLSYFIFGTRPIRVIFLLPVVSNCVREP